MEIIDVGFVLYNRVDNLTNVDTKNQSLVYHKWVLSALNRSFC